MGRKQHEACNFTALMYLDAVYERDPELAIALEQLAQQRINVYDRQTILERSFGHIATIKELVYISDGLGYSEGVY